tara:strand:+ start:6900 stop:8135 length:1236 start_codon:yes stop_codon:yes gene_type:complete
MINLKNSIIALVILLIISIIVYYFVNKDKYTSTDCKQTNHPVKTITNNFPDVFGYFGNSKAEEQVGHLTFDSFPDIYNIIVVTFGQFDVNGKCYLIIHRPIGSYKYGKYSDMIESNYLTPSGEVNLSRDGKKWLAKPDPFGRKKRILLSIGGPDFQPPNGETGVGYIEPEKKGQLRKIPGFKDYPFSQAIINGITDLIIYRCRGIFSGIDLNFQGESRKIFKVKEDVWNSVIVYLKQNIVFANQPDKKFWITCSPQASDESLDDYMPLISRGKYDYIMTKFYNTGPEKITSNYGVFWDDVTDDLSDWAGEDNAWQHMCNLEPVTAMEYVALKLMQHFVVSAGSNGEYVKLVISVPASVNAAELFSCWDYTKLCNVLTDENAPGLACWCIEEDKLNGQIFTKAVSRMMNRPM